MPPSLYRIGAVVGILLYGTRFCPARRTAAVRMITSALGMIPLKLDSVDAYNEPIAAVMVGLLLSLSAGVRITLPLLAVNLLAFYHVITLPENMHWLGTRSTLIILTVAFAVETLVHFIPAAGTYLKALATPLAFVAGTLLMAVPLGDKNPLYQWTLAAGVGGSAAMFTHLGVTGVRTLTAPASFASFGIFGFLWNTGELVVSLLLTALSGLCVVAGWAAGAVILLGIAVFLLIAVVKGFRRLSAEPPAAAKT